MIAKKIERKSSRDDYRACARYIAAAEKGRQVGEKLLCKWYAGGEAEDFQEGLLEVELTQALNTRSHGPKTYHLVASFHLEEVFGQPEAGQGRSSQARPKIQPGK